MSRVASKPSTAETPQHLAHLALQLEWLDTMLARRAWQLQQFWAGRSELARTRADVITHEEIDWLLGAGAENDASHAALEQRVATAAERVRAAESQSDSASAFARLTDLFQLQALEVAALLLCLAPELRRRYDRIYAYLQDDITRSRPSVDLALDLFCHSEAERWQARAAFEDCSPLLRHRLLQVEYDGHSPSGSTGLARLLRVDSRIVAYLTGDQRIDSRLQAFVRLWSFSPAQLVAELLPQELPGLQALLQRWPQQISNTHLIVHWLGPVGVGKKHAAAVLCQRMGWPLLVIDVPKLMAGNDWVQNVRLIARESLLQQAPCYFDRAELLWQGDGNELSQLLSVTSEYGWLNFFGSSDELLPERLAPDVVWHPVRLAMPNADSRLAYWQRQACAKRIASPVLQEIARQYRLVPRQISAAAAELQALAEEKLPVSLADAARACRAQSSHKLAELAVRLSATSHRSELVLPADVSALLDMVLQQVRHQHQVFEQWQFGQRLSYGRGLSVLFCGPPGVGKTMAAQVLANELQRDLYKIDLAAVVSKYIGETEKNLGRIFSAAETSNALLFFDEADALFGKRTDVSDAHDRYANIEVSYLLQRMEEYDGMVILSTNLRDNIDEAFCRRIRFVVDFPFPDAACRSQIWRTQLPAAVPVEGDIDFDWLGAKLKIAGGSIKNIALNAAFLAAAGTGVVGMRDIQAAARCEYQKIGKLWDLDWAPQRC